MKPLSDRSRLSIQCKPGEYIKIQYGPRDEDYVLLSNALEWKVRFDARREVKIFRVTAEEL